MQIYMHLYRNHTCLCMYTCMHTGLQSHVCVYIYIYACNVYPDELGSYPKDRRHPRNYPVRFGLRLVRIMGKLRAEHVGREAPPHIDARQVFGGLCFDDVWEDAMRPQCVQYLRGSTSLQIPPAWRLLLPSDL